ncbi:hypothetical protein TR74_01110, partial [Carbonactinospora thermoautotrophica]
MRRLLRAGSLLTASGMLLLAIPTPAAAGVSNQWALQKLRAQEAWKYTQGEGVTVGLVDSGADATHPDLRGQVVPGKAFQYNSGDGTTDPDGHGTAMASIIAGTGEGAKGVLGLAPKAQIFPLVTAAFGSPDPLTRAEAIKYAADHGFKVINISQSGVFSNPELAKDNSEKRAVEYALRNDVVIVAAAGNDGRSTPNYPAAYPGVIAVTAVDRHGKPWAKTQHGPWVTVAAPGVDIYAAEPGGSYDTGSGTSAATAYVSAT